MQANRGNDVGTSAWRRLRRRTLRSRVPRCGRGAVKRSRAFYWTAWIGVAGAATFVGTSLAGGPITKPNDCPGAIVDRANYVGPPPPDHALLRFVDPRTKLDFQFDDSRSPIRRQIPVSVVDGQRAPKSGLNNRSGLNVKLGGQQVFDGPGTHEFSSTDVQMSLEPLSEHQISICIRLDPAQLAASPGLYRGTIGVAFSDVMRTSPVDVDVTFRASRAKAMLIVVLGVFLGLVVKVLSEAAVIARTTGTRGLRAVWLYMSELMFPVTLILSVISGVFAYVTLYAHDRDWGAEADDSLRLFATCFLLQMGTSEILAVLNRFGGGGGSPGAVGASGS